jgi:N-formylglutamate deformylase
VRVVPGDDPSHVLLHVPHGSTHVPGDVRERIRLSDDELAVELALITDAHTALLAERAATTATVTPWMFVNDVSRLVVDPERFPDEREEMNAVGMGAVYTRTTHGAVLRAGDDAPGLLDRYFHPYAEALTRTVDDRLAAARQVTLIDVHSYPSRPLPYELHGTGARPPVCLGTDPFHTPPGLLRAAREVFGDTAENTPFAGCYVPLKHYGRERSVSSIMIEIRRDTYMDEPGGPPHDGLETIAEALKELINRIERDR